MMIELLAFFTYWILWFGFWIPVLYWVWNKIFGDKPMTKQEYIETLESWIDDHDCHISPEDGCDCIAWRGELNALYQDWEPRTSRISG